MYRKRVFIYIVVIIITNDVYFLCLKLSLALMQYSCKAITEQVELSFTTQMALQKASITFHIINNVKCIKSKYRSKGSYKDKIKSAVKSKSRRSMQGY